MFKYFHRIGGIGFYTQSSDEIPLLRSGCFEKFSKKELKPDVTQKLFSIHADQLPSDPSQTREIESLVQHLPENPLQRGSLIFPPVLEAEEIERIIQSQEAGKPPCPPLFKSEFVRSHLGAYLKMRDIRVIIHSLSIEIYDYANNTTVIFFHAALLKHFTGDFLFNGIRRLFTSALPSFSAFVIHSSGVNLDERTALFLGPDEGGKTTVAKMPPTDLVLCDDYNIIKRIGKQFFAYGTPWGTMANSQNEKRLGGLFFLEKSSFFDLTPIPSAQAVERIWNDNSRFVQFSPKVLKTKAFELVCDICQHVPAYRMSFPREQIDWKQISQSMNERH